MNDQEIEKAKAHEHRHTVVEEAIEYIKKELDDIKDNHLAHLNKKFNWMMLTLISILIGVIYILVELVFMR